MSIPLFDTPSAVVKDAGISECGQLPLLRATDPKELWRHPDPIGRLNGDELALAAYNEPVTMLAWGANAPISRAKHVARLLWLRSQVHGTRLAVLGWTKAGAPGHPLYVRLDQPPEYCDEGELFE